MGFYRRSAGNLLNSRNNSFQWIGTWWKNSYFARKHRGFVLSQWWLWWYNSACSFSVSSLAFPLTTVQIPPHHSPWASPHRDWWGLGDLQESSSLGKSSICEQGSCSKLPRRCRGTALSDVQHHTPLCRVFCKRHSCLWRTWGLHPAGAVPSSLHSLPLEPCHGPKFGLFPEPEYWEDWDKDYLPVTYVDLEK